LMGLSKVELKLEASQVLAHYKDEVDKPRSHVAQARFAPTIGNQPNSTKYMETKLELTGRVKNTFLNFADGDSESSGERRPSSDPTSQSSNCSNWSESEESEGGRIYRFRGAANLKQPVRSQLKSQGKVESDEVQDCVEQHGGTEQPNPQWRCTRPCKARRERFRKYVDKMKAQVAEDPAGFTMDKVNVPEKLVPDERGRKKVASILENYRTQVLSQGTAAQPVTGTSGCSAEGLPPSRHFISL